jgi:hypothetical protein
MTTVGFIMIALLVSATPGSAQALLETDPGNSVRTRADLERLVAFYDEVLESPAYSDRVKREASLNMERVRARLRDGDFRVGDRIVLTVEGEPSLPDTLAVETGPKVVLPVFGEIPLAGVLRSEIQQHLTTQLSAFIRNPVVRANALMRVSIQGQVGAPGFYVVPAEMLVSDALMVGGGPAVRADLEALRIERGAELLLEGRELQEALREGRTLDQLNLQAGDQIFLPEQGGGLFGGFLGNVMLGVIPAVLIAVLVGR